MFRGLVDALFRSTLQIYLPLGDSVHPKPVLAVLRLNVEAINICRPFSKLGFAKTVCINPLLWDVRIATYGVWLSSEQDILDEKMFSGV